MKGDDIDGKGNLVFRSVRWWLRRERKQKIVAVFAGTTAKLANFFPPDPPKEAVSRLPEVIYKNCAEGQLDKTTKLFPPFLPSIPSDVWNLIWKHRTLSLKLLQVCLRMSSWIQR